MNHFSMDLSAAYPAQRHEGRVSLGEAPRSAGHPARGSRPAWPFLVRVQRRSDLLDTDTGDKSPEFVS